MEAGPTEKLRISFVLPLLDYSGGTRVAAIYAERLRRRGHEVHVVAPPGRRPPSLARRLRARPAPAPRPAGSHFDATEVPVRILPRWRPVRDRDLPDADAVVATWWETAEWVGRLSPRKGAKVYFVQGHEAQADWIGAARVARAEATYRDRRFLPVVIAGWLAELLRTRYGCPEVRLVPNAVDHARFHAPPRGRQPRPTLGLVYSTHPLKGCDVALAALAAARDRHPGLRLRVFGGHPVRPDLPLPPGAEYAQAPPQEAIREIYAGCDALVWTSRAEGFGLPLLEAMACRTPVIATAAGAAPDLVVDGVNGWLVPVDDAGAVGAAIDRLAALPEAAWRAMSEAAHRTAAGYDWDRSAELFEEALRAAAAGAAGPPGRAPQ